jgi:DNA-binding GntR family transcriptional regulator
MNMPGALSLPTRGMKIRRPVLADRVHEKLKGLILDQRFSPGMHLNIDQLCVELNVSSSPLREALARLTAERLVQVQPFIGYSVTEMPGREYYVHLMELRLLLECHAARIGAKKGNSSIIGRMEQTLCAMEKARSALLDPGNLHYKAYQTFHSWDEQFHLALIAGAESQPLIEAYGGLHVHLHIARLYVVANGFDTVTPVQDHRKILEAFAASDPAGAEQAVRDHICVSIT